MVLIYDSSNSMNYHCFIFNSFFFAQIRMVSKFVLVWEVVMTSGVQGGGGGDHLV